jgi:protein-S-isoprenylcysteine O-methyltransferase Ste14
MFILKLIYSLVMQGALFGLLLFIPARTLAWPRAWIFIGGVMIGTTVTMFYLRDSKDLINERLKGPLQRGQPAADKVVTVLFLIAFCALFAFIPLDVFHLHVMGHPGLLMSVFGLVLAAAGWWLVALALHENAFAAGVVKYQKERHQRVIDSGIYSKVRHPMYAGAIPFLIGSCLWLGSDAAALMALIPIAGFALRIQIEERFLCRELAGYQSYTERIRYRLIPHLW